MTKGAVVMFHSIIGDYDVFFAGNEGYYQNQCLGASYSVDFFNNTPEHKSFFSTNPAEHLRIIQAENKFI